MASTSPELRHEYVRDGSSRGGRNGPLRRAPHNLEAEESLLGAMLLSNDAIADALERCQPGDFYKAAHGHIFESVVSLYSSGHSIDPVTVADDLSRKGLLDAVGGPGALITLQANTPAISNSRRYAEIVEEHSLLRRLLAAAQEIGELAVSVPENVDEVIDQAESMVFEVGQRRIVDSMAPIRELLAASLDRLEHLYEVGSQITGVPTGYADLDRLLSGLQPSNLLIVGARPAMGKTSFATGIVAHAAMEHGVPVLMFSLEMSHLELTQRLLCAEARVDATKLRTGNLDEEDWRRISQAVGRLGEAPIFIDDNPMLTVMDIRGKARRLKARGGLGLIVVDYLQLMSGRNGAENRQVEVSEISRGLKILARELEVPIVALSQLSRNLETRTDKRPLLADLRESGSLEQDADVVMFIYRDEVYNQDSTERGMAEILVAKHRNGPIGVEKLAFLDRYSRFANMVRA
jgi:replicative DNA helicase